jgi:hypothetical protein
MAEDQELADGRRVWDLVMPRPIRRWVARFWGASLAALTIIGTAATAALEFGWKPVGLFTFWFILILIVAASCFLHWRFWVALNGEIRRADREQARAAQATADFQAVGKAALQALDRGAKVAQESAEAIARQRQEREELNAKLADLTERIHSLGQTIQSLGSDQIRH